MLLIRRDRQERLPIFSIWYEFIQPLPLSIFENKDTRITLKAISDGAAFGLCLKSDEHYHTGTEFVLDPRREKAGFRPCNDNSYAEYGHDSIYNLEVLGAPVTLDIVVTEYLIDVCIGGKRTVITKSESVDTGVVCLFTQCGTVVFEDIRVSPV